MCVRAHMYACVFVSGSFDENTLRDACIQLNRRGSYSSLFRQALYPETAPWENPARNLRTPSLSLSLALSRDTYL